MSPSEEAGLRRDEGVAGVDELSAFSWAAKRHFKAMSAENVFVVFQHASRTTP